MFIDFEKLEKAGVEVSTESAGVTLSFKDYDANLFGEVIRMLSSALQVEAGYIEHDLDKMMGTVESVKILEIINER